MDTNVLSYGDDLDILRRYLPDAAVDLRRAVIEGDPRGHQSGRRDAWPSASPGRDRRWPGQYVEAAVASSDANGTWTDARLSLEEKS